MLRFRSVSVSLALLLVLGLGCGEDDNPATQIVLTVDTTLSVPGQIDAVRLDVTGGMAPQERFQNLPSDGDLPLVLALSQPEGEATMLELTIRGLKGGAGVVERRVRTMFVPEESRSLHVVLARECASLDCGGDTCGNDGTCTSVDVGTLAGFDGTTPGRVDAGEPCEGPDICDGEDNDCDGMIDEVTADLCPSAAGVLTGTCIEGTCTVMSCQSGQSDCNGAYGDGCEAETANDKENCGECGNVCPGAGVCSAGACSPPGWARSIGAGMSAESETVSAIGRDTAGNLYIAGSLSGNSRVGDDPIAGGGSAREAFIAKFAPTGAFVTAMRVATFSSVRDMHIRGDNIFVVGRFRDTGNFNPLGEEAVMFSSADDSDIFIAQYNTDLQVVAARAFGSLTNDEAHSIVATSDAAIVVAGTLTGPASVDGMSFVAGGFVARFRIDAELSGPSHLRSLGDAVQIRDLAVDSGQNVYMVADYMGTASVGGDAFTGAGSIVASFNGTTGHRWSRAYSAADGFVKVSAVATDGTGVYLGGPFRGRLGFSAGLTSGSMQDAYVVAVSADTGATRWAEHIASPFAANVEDIKVDAARRVFVSGSSIDGLSIGAFGHSISGTTGFLAALAQNASRTNVDNVRGMPRGNAASDVIISTLDIAEDVSCAGGTFTSSADLLAPIDSASARLGVGGSVSSLMGSDLFIMCFETSALE